MGRFKRFHWNANWNTGKKKKKNRPNFVRYLFEFLQLSNKIEDRQFALRTMQDGFSFLSFELSDYNN